MTPGLFRAATHRTAATFPYSEKFLKGARFNVEADAGAERRNFLSASPGATAGLLLCLCLFCSGCYGAAPKATPPDPTGITGTRDAKAEQLYAKARVLWREGELCSAPEQAVIYLEQAVALDPEYAEAWLRLGLARSETGQIEEAFEDLTRSLRLNPTADAYAYRGLVLLRQGDYKSARRDLDRALQTDPGSHRALSFRAAVNLKENDLEAACRDFKAACKAGNCLGLEAAHRQNMCR